MAAPAVRLRAPRLSWAETVEDAGAVDSTCLIRPRLLRAETVEDAGAVDSTCLIRLGLGSTRDVLWIQIIGAPMLC